MTPPYGMQQEGELMSPEDHFPPPGGAPPPGAGSGPTQDPAPGQGPAQGPPPGPGWAPYPTGQAGGPPPGWAPPPPGYATGAAHKPGALPLRPLGLGDIYDAAFRIIRYNPRATVGSAVLVAAAAMSVPVVLTAVLSVVLDLSLDTGGGLFQSPAAGVIEPSGTADVAGIVVAYGSILLGSFAQSIGLLFVTGMVAHVTAAAAVGRRLSLGEAWAATAGRRLHLVGLSLLVSLVFVVLVTAYVLSWVAVVLATDSVAVLVLWGLLSFFAFVALCVWLWMRFNYLAVPALMLERTGVVAALGRSFRLTRRQFWRTFGIALLTLLIVQVAGSILTTPVSLLTAFASDSSAFSGYELLVTVVGQALAAVIAAAFVSPFSAAVASLQYVDQRMRKEAYDVELMSQAGITGA